MQSGPLPDPGVCSRPTRMGFGGILRAAGTRPFRVITLVTMIAIMSVMDLYLTLLYVTNTGMSEANPFARAMMGYQSPTILAIWKLATVVLSLGILVVIRTKRSAEIGAWIECFVLGWLMIHWTVYIETTSDQTHQIVQSEGSLDPNWIMIEAGAGLGNLVID